MERQDKREEIRERERERERGGGGNRDTFRQKEGGKDRQR